MRLLFQPLQPDDLIGHTFLTTLKEDSQCFCAHVIRCIEEIDDATGKACTKFIIHKSNDELDEIMGYLELLGNS